MIGRFLELGVQTDSILDSIGFYEDLGFKQLNAGDIWQHPYAVVSDGVINIGLHATALPAPMITFVLPDLADELVEFRSRGIRFLVEKTGNDQFNELVFEDTDANSCIRILEARTFSPASFDHADSICGRFREISLPVRDIEAAGAFWLRMGFEELGQAEHPHPHVWLRGDGVVLGLHQTSNIASPALSFQSEDISRHLAQLRQIGIETGDTKAPTGVAALSSPEGTPVFLHGI